MHKFLVLLLSCASLFGEAKVTYELSRGGRLGDQLVSYLHAKWISYHYGFPLVYRPFEHSDYFAFHNLEESFPKIGTFKLIKVKNLNVLKHEKKSVLYEILYTPECAQEYELYPFLLNRAPKIEINWSDKAFLELARSFLAPRHSIELLSLPKDKVTVALHIRKPVGYDAGKGYEKKFPHKFIPISFYIDHLRLLYEEMGKKPLYVFIFSNDPEPQKIADELHAALNLSNITFDYRKADENPNSTRVLLSDFYSMMQFDCMIRPESNLSLIASKLGNQKIIIWPEHVTSSGVDRVRIDRNSPF